MILNIICFNSKILKQYLLNRSENKIRIWDFNFKKKTNKTKIDDKIVSEQSNLLIRIEVIFKIIQLIKKNSKKNNIKILYLSPQGKKLSQKEINYLSKEKELILICGKNRGIDDRIINIFINKEISIGDYITSCGEIALLTLLDSINRIKNLKNNILKADSFNDLIFDHTNYTKPKFFLNFKIPDVLTNNNYKKKKWKIIISKKKTFLYRPDFKF